MKLRHSQISFLPANVFTELPNLINLDISGNNLIELHIPLFLKLNKLTHLILDENEWQCNEKFKEFQSWIKQRDIQFDLQCEYTEGQEHMFEKIISLVNEDSDENELPEFWEHSSEIIPNENINDNISTSDTAIQLFHLYDTTFPSSWSLLLGLQIGGLFGALITYCCMSGLCSCKSIKLVSRRQRIREARLHLQEGRELLLSVIHANVETPPVARRQLSNDGAFCRTYSWEAGSDQNPNNISSNDNNQPSDLRSETPPPAYTTCIDDIILTPK